MLASGSMMVGAGWLIISGPGWVRFAALGVVLFWVALAAWPVFMPSSSTTAAQERRRDAHLATPGAAVLTLRDVPAVADADHRATVHTLRDRLASDTGADRGRAVTTSRPHGDEQGGRTGSRAPSRVMLRLVRNAEEPLPRPGMRPGA